jgi:pimeloyl-ACP methyl ester carboxylesterase
MHKFKLLLLILIGSIVGISLAGYAYQTTMDKRDREAYPAPGKFYEVGGLNLHLDCRGEGSPTVILEAGLTSGSFSWALVHDQIAAKTRVCAYDRPGMDWSDPIGRVADAKEVSDRLYELLEVAGIEGPRVMLGMSAGGVYVREFYKNHPENIVGMVFVDSSHEQQQNRLPDFDPGIGYKAMMIACRILQPIGIVRMFNFLDPFVDQLDLDESSRNALLANMNQAHSCSSMHWESESFMDEVVDELPPQNLGDLPLVVLSQGEEPKAMPEYGVTVEQAIAQREVWNVLQQELTDLSTDSERFIALESGHVIQLYQPELMINKVTDLVLRLRDEQ